MSHIKSIAPDTYKIRAERKFSLVPGRVHTNRVANGLRMF